MMSAVAAAGERAHGLPAHSGTQPSMVMLTVQAYQKSSTAWILNFVFPHRIVSPPELHKLIFCFRLMDHIIVQF